MRSRNGATREYRATAQSVTLNADYKILDCTFPIPLTVLASISGFSPAINQAQPGLALCLLPFSYTLFLSNFLAAHFIAKSHRALQRSQALPALPPCSPGRIRILPEPQTASWRGGMSAFFASWRSVAALKLPSLFQTRKGHHKSRSKSRLDNRARSNSP